MSALTLDLIKKQAKRMQLSFACRGIDLKLAHCYEALSVMHGYKDWNVFCALLKRGSIQEIQDDDFIGDNEGNLL